MKIDRPYYIKKLIDSMWNGSIKVITGIRRSGKSYLLNVLFRNYLHDIGVDDESIIVFELDKLKDMRYRNPLMLAETVKKTIDGKSKDFYLFIDEIQLSNNAKNPWDKNGDDVTFYDMLIELMGIPNLDIYVTGSNSKMLSSEIVTNFRGRDEQIRVHPLSFSEFFSAVDLTKEQALDEYFWFGGMPGLFLKKNNEAKMEYLQSLFKEIYLKDLIEHDKVKNPALLEGVLDALCSAVGSLTNANRLSNVISSRMHIKTNDITVRHYMDLLEDSFLFSRARRYDIKGNSYFDTSDKFYSEDIGLRNARLGFRQQEKPHIMENIIYNELLSRGFIVDVGVVKSRENQKDINREIDFVVNKYNERIYIQSSYTMDNPNKINQETKPFRLTEDSFRKIIIRTDTAKRWFDNKGILHINLIDFLMDKDFI